MVNEPMLLNINSQCCLKSSPPKQRIFLLLSVKKILCGPANPHTTNGALFNDYIVNG